MLGKRVMSVSRAWTAAGAVALGLLLGAGASSGFAADPKGEVDVQVNMARILRLPSAASTVVIGNPAIADARYKIQKPSF